MRQAKELIMELTVGQWYLDTPARSWMNHALVKITGFGFNIVEFEDSDNNDGEMSAPQFMRTFAQPVARRAEGPELAGHPTYRDYYTLDLCTCCYIALVNGDPCDCADDSQQHPDGLMGKLEGAEVTPGSFASQHESQCLTYLLDSADVPSGYECECERDSFSTLPCGGCGTYLYGGREKATGWILR